MYAIDYVSNISILFSNVNVIIKRSFFGIIALIYYALIVLSISKPVLSTTLTIKWAWLYIVWVNLKTIYVICDKWIL